MRGREFPKRLYVGAHLNEVDVRSQEGLRSNTSKTCLEDRTNVVEIKDKDSAEYFEHISESREIPMYNGCLGRTSIEVDAFLVRAHQTKQLSMLVAHFSLFTPTIHLHFHPLASDNGNGLVLGRFGSVQVWGHFPRMLNLNLAFGSSSVQRSNTFEPVKKVAFFRSKDLNHLKIAHKSADGQLATFTVRVRFGVRTPPGGANAEPGVWFKAGNFRTLNLNLVFGPHYNGQHDIFPEVHSFITPLLPTLLVIPLPLRIPLKN
ncbi:hypothetical protein FB451DRAFT_1164410 [Mycena latifolia]|nr:hypothetical protein FB451DRAFT_1164410 [Mycena latifolia]